MRSLLAAAVAVVLLPAGLWAEEIRGTVTKVDASKNMLTLKVGEMERTVKCDPKCRVTMLESRRAFPRRTSVQEYLSSLSNVPTGSSVTVMLESRDGAEMATEVRMNQTAGSSGGRLFRFRR